MSHPRSSATPEPTRRSLRTTTPTTTSTESAAPAAPSRRGARSVAQVETPRVAPAHAAEASQAPAPSAIVETPRVAESPRVAPAAAAAPSPATPVTRRARTTAAAPVAPATPTKRDRTLRALSTVERPGGEASVAASQPAVELHVEPVVVAEPLLAADSAAEPVALDTATIDADETPDLVEAFVEDVPAHTILDDLEPERPARADAFEEAARALAFTGELPVVDRSEAAVAPPVTTATITGDLVPRRRRAIAKKLAAASVSLGALAMVGLLTVGMTTPAQAVASVAATSAPNALAGDVGGAASGDVQAYVVPSTSADAQLDRTESYSTGTMVDLAGTVGITHYSDQYFTNNVNCKIQWPFATGTTISYGFGWRDGEFHEGVDFTPGEGAHIQAVADGVVSASTDSGGGYGVMIIIDIVVDGQPYSIRYGHMEYGSRQVQVGDKVSVGEFIGQTGDTGYSFGAHTHVEVLQNGTTPIDPMPWFQKYATC